MTTPPGPGALRYRLPLFPLPVVLYPGARMPLHVFEPRYRDLVRESLDGDGRFGVVYHDSDRRGPFLFDDGRVGCVAEIVEHEFLRDGRSLIVVDGIERFEVVDGIESDALYYEALVTPYADALPSEEPSLVERRSLTIALFVELLGRFPDPPDTVPELTPDEETSFRLAQTIGVDPQWHQELLESRDEAARLDALDEVFRAALS